MVVFNTQNKPNRLLERKRNRERDVEVGTVECVGVALNTFFVSSTGKDLSEDCQLTNTHGNTGIHMALFFHHYLKFVRGTSTTEGESRVAQFRDARFLEKNKNTNWADCCNQKRD